MTHKILADLIQQTYPAVVQALPSAGRRQRVLEVLHTGWPSALAPSNSDAVELTWEDLDQDPLDTFINSSEAQGILLRTDFSNDAHWDSFIAKVEESERELLDSLRPTAENPEVQGSSASDADVDMNPSEQQGGEEDEEEDEEDEAGLPESIITPFNPPPTSHPLFTNISNLTALRLFNDIDIRSAILPPTELEKSRYGPRNVLINLNGWQEVYEGKNLWIYDSKSIQDDCVRVVEQVGGVYGAATGDSWRARITHIPELQFNMAFLGMKIDFGGLDRWDAQERARNLAEAAIL